MSAKPRLTVFSSTTRPSDVADTPELFVRTFLRPVISFSLTFLLDRSKKMAKICKGEVSPFQKQKEVRSLVPLSFPGNLDGIDGHALLLCPGATHSFLA